MYYYINSAHSSNTSMAKDDNFFEKHSGKIGAAGLALNALQNQQIQKNQKELGRIQAENARLQQERNELLKKQIEEEERRKEKQYQLLKLAPQLKQFLKKLSDDKDREGKEIGLLLELCTQLHQYLHENDEYVNDVKFHEFLMEIAPLISELEEKHQDELDEYNKMIRELNLGIEQVQPLLEIIDLLENVDVDYLYRDDVDTSDVLRKCRVLRDSYDKINDLIQKLDKYIEFDPNSSLSQINYLNQDILQSIVSLSTEEAIDIKQKLIGLPDKEWVQEKTKQILEYIAGKKKASKITTKVEENNTKYILEGLIADIQDLPTPIRKRISPKLLNHIEQLIKYLNQFEESKQTSDLNRLYELFGETYYSRELIEDYGKNYSDAEKKVRLNYGVATSIILLISNLILFFLTEIKSVLIFMLNIFFFFGSLLVILSISPKPSDLSEYLDEINEQTQFLKHNLKEIKTSLKVNEGRL